ncbi:MAG TPA: type VI secretion system baseplate subunit TssG [Pirellulales bacterium]|nr:type VI secretion system baseplate subunit TssG [Pirellulales bacterium]
MAIPSGRPHADLTTNAVEAASTAQGALNAALAGDVSDALAAQLIAEPYRFDFFQSIRVLGRIFPDRRPVGLDSIPADELVRFRSYLSLSFPPSEVHEVLPPAQSSAPLRMVVAFMGLVGPSAALPRHYTEMLLERAKQKDRTLYDFLDMFQHRLVSLFYRAWERNRFWACFERAELEGRAWRAAGADRYRSFVLDERPRHDPVAQILLEVVGLGPPALRYRSQVRDRLAGRTLIDDGTVRFYAGLLAQQHRSAVGLEGMVRDYFDVPATVEQFCGQWLKLEPENQSSLSLSGNTCLGANVVIGERFWDRQGKFRIRLGPVGYAQFNQFLPPGSAFRPLSDLTRLYAGITFDVDVQLVLRAEEIPSCRLGDSAGGSRLGWDTWIRSNEFSNDVEDAVFALAN